MRYRHQACANGAKTIAVQHVQSQGAQQGQHLHPFALALGMSVLTELRVAWSVPLVFDRPALAHKPQQRLRAGTQCGDVDEVGRKPYRWMWC